MIEKTIDEIFYKFYGHQEINIWEDCDWPLGYPIAIIPLKGELPWSEGNSINTQSSPRQRTSVLLIVIMPEIVNFVNRTLLIAIIAPIAPW